MTRARGVVASLVAWLVVGCGYAPVHGHSASSGGAGERLSVVLSSSSVPDVVTTDEVLAGVRDELAKGGVLAPGAGYPRCEVEVLRADESSEGIASMFNSDGRRMPTSRATRLGITGRAWVVRSPDDARHGDTGDVRAVDVASVAPTGEAAAFQYDDGLRAAARRLGHKLGARIVGLPVATED